MNATLLIRESDVSVAAENSIGSVKPGMAESSRAYFRRKAQPARVQPVNVTREGFVLEVEFLQLQMKEGAESAQQQIVHDEAVELMAVHCEMPQAAVLPRVLLVSFHPNQV